ncbi:hypothetical protein EJB05_26055, partial [Eragrostis curvula]
MDHDRPHFFARPAPASSGSWPPIDGTSFDYIVSDDCWHKVRDHCNGHVLFLNEDDDGARRLMEWPPPSWTWQGFSSVTGRWEERVFVRENEAAGTIASLELDARCRMVLNRWRHSAYWRGDLYIHCRGEYYLIYMQPTAVMFCWLSLSNNKYQVIKSPIDLVECNTNIGVRSFLGRSENGVYF